jgi:DNA-binding CsgD family transcriptional regulator
VSFVGTGFVTHTRKCNRTLSCTGGIVSDDLYGSRELTPAEQRMSQLIAGGLTNREIADELGTTRNMVMNRLRVIYDKVGVWSRLELALWYVSRHQVMEVAPEEARSNARDQDKVNSLLTPNDPSRTSDSASADEKGRLRLLPAHAPDPKANSSRKRVSRMAEKFSPPRRRLS